MLVRPLPPSTSEGSSAQEEAVAAAHRPPARLAKSGAAGGADGDRRPRTSSGRGGAARAAAAEPTGAEKERLCGLARGWAQARRCRDYSSADAIRSEIRRAGLEPEELLALAEEAGVAAGGMAAGGGLGGGGGAREVRRAEGRRGVSSLDWDEAEGRMSEMVVDDTREERVGGQLRVGGEACGGVAGGEADERLRRV